MRIRRVSLTNFRNYEHAVVDLSDARNVLIGENAQGKTNFLEAIEVISSGKSTRAQKDQDLVRQGTGYMLIEVLFESRGAEETVSVSLSPSDKRVGKGLEKKIKLNGLSVTSARGLRGRLVTVSFKSSDLNLLRGGPKYRREWIDEILVTLRPSVHDLLGRYQKVVSQRNRLLKTLFEKGRVTVSDQDQMRVWDEQLAKLGAEIITLRISLLGELLPRAERHQEQLSGSKERLTAKYLFHTASEEPEMGSTAVGLDLTAMVDGEIAQALLKVMKERRAEEIARKQTLCGPHRDDIRFCLNGANAVDFASQGQQRSLVLSFKLAELDRVQENLNESPVLLLDDVLAELDLNRQGHLMSLVKSDMQTLITTTDVSGLKPEWVEGARFLTIADGSVLDSRQTASPLVL